MSNQEEPAQNNLSETQNQLENSLKDLLEKILSYMEKYISTKDDLQEIESKLNDYDNLLSLVDIIKNVFSHLTIKIDNFQSKPNPNLQDSKIMTNEEYDQLEKTVQKHEAEIRTHIRLEQQLKLYAESLQSKLDDSEKTRTELLESTKNIINGVKRDNQKLNDNLKQMKDEKEKLLERLKQLEEKEKTYEKQLTNLPYMQEKITTLEKLVQQERQPSYSMYGIQKENSYKKLSGEMIDLKKKTKSDVSTPPVGQSSNSPQKIEQKRAPTPSILQSNNSSNLNKTKDFKNSYQKFYNQVKQAREESLKNMLQNKDIKTIYSNSQLQLQKNSLKDKDLKSLINTTATMQQQVSSTTQINQNNAINSTHKRSKSHQVSKMKGMPGPSKNQTDYSHLSGQEFSEAPVAISISQEKFK